MFILINDIVVWCGVSGVVSCITVLCSDMRNDVYDAWKYCLLQANIERSACMKLLFLFDFWNGYDVSQLPHVWYDVSQLLHVWYDVSQLPHVWYDVSQLPHVWYDVSVKIKCVYIWDKRFQEVLSVSGVWCWSSTVDLLISLYFMAFCDVLNCINVA